MRKILPIAFLMTIMILCGCRKQDKYELTYSTALYKPMLFSSDCDSLFSQPKILIDLDTFRLKSYTLIKHPIYSHCEENLKLNRFFTANQQDRFPFYIGVVRGNPNIKLFTFNSFTGKYVSSVEGYFTIRQKEAFLIFKGYQSYVSYPTSLIPYFYKNHLLLWEETDESYDVGDDSRSKIIEVKFCILKIKGDNTVVIVSKKEGYDLIKRNLFPNLPQLSSLAFR